MARKRNYINNKDLFKSMSDHISSIKNGENPRIPEYVGKSIQLICKNLSTKPNFSGYSYRDDMISDGILDCVAAVKNFDPTRTNNPFAYFTQIAKNAFIRRITKEKKQTYLKHKNFENSFLSGELYKEDLVGQHITNEYSNEIIRNFEEKLTKAKKPAIVKGVEKFIEE